MTYKELIDLGKAIKFFQDPKTKEIFEYTPELEEQWLKNKNTFSLVYKLID